MSVPLRADCVLPRTGLLCISVAAVLWIACGAVTAAQAAEEKNRLPHLVLFLSDDHGAADAGCYGNPDVRTPHLDRLAEEGLRFERAYCASPSCTPSRSALFTGLMPARNGAHPNHSSVREGTRSPPALSWAPGLPHGSLWKKSRLTTLGVPFRICRRSNCSGRTRSREFA